MKQLITIISLVLMLVQAGTANAEIINLVCIATNGYPTNIDIDTDKNTVIAAGVFAERVHIDKGVITFTLLYPNGAKWFHSINRNTGGMIITDATTNTVNSKYKCEKAKPKF